MIIGSPLLETKNKSLYQSLVNSVVIDAEFGRKSYISISTITIAIGRELNHLMTKLIPE
jgi:hypothetical protein